jgi:hypothetical protein
MGKRTHTTTTALRPAQMGYRRFNTRHQDTTRTHWFTWRHVRCKVLETSQFGRLGTLLQLEVIASRDTPVPITRTGYLAHGIDSEELSLDREAAKRAYKKSEARWRQPDLLELLESIDRDRDA